MKETNRKKDTETVVVIGCNYSSNLCMARSLGQAGYKVEVVRVFQHKPKLMGIMRLLRPDAHSRYVTKYSECFANGDSSCVAEFLTENAQATRLVIPTDDYNAAAIDDSYDMLKEWYIMPHAAGRQGGITALMSKETQMQFARRCGVTTVASCRITAENGVAEIPQDIKYPCFIKPDISKNSSKSYMKRCDSETELRTALERFSAGRKIDMIAEDFLEVDREYSLLGLSAGGRVVAPGLFVAEKGGTNERKGITLVGRMVDTAPYRKEIDEVISFVRQLDYSGLFDADFIGTRDGRLHFIELNLRYGASGYAVTQSGVNLPAMFADYMLNGKEIDTACTLSQTGESFISEKVMVEEYIKSTLTAGDIKQLMGQTDVHFIKNSTDTAPYCHFKKFYLPATVLKCMYTAKRLLKGR